MPVKTGNWKKRLSPCSRPAPHHWEKGLARKAARERNHTMGLFLAAIVLEGTEDIRNHLPKVPKIWGRTLGELEGSPREAPGDQTRSARVQARARSSGHAAWAPGMHAAPAFLPGAPEPVQRVPQPLRPSPGPPGSVPCARSGAQR